MRVPLKGEYPITQSFGNKDITFNGKLVKNYYSKWNLNGHNGIDYGTPLGTPVYAPHNGEVLEAAFDEGGYGKYIKIENDTEGSVLAHLQSIVIQVGFKVKEGDIIGYTNNTGASTGPHLHWGYYRKPRNKNNGYNGFVDPTPYIGSVKIYIPAIKEDKFNSYIVKPNIDIPVGKEPGKESFNYGRIGPDAFAKIIGIKQVDDKFYYNIDQTFIGGGTGWVVAETLDKAPLFVEKPIEEKPKDVLTFESVAKKYNIQTPQELNTKLDLYLNSPKTVDIDTNEVKIDTKSKEVTVPIKFNADWLIKLFGLDQLFKGGDNNAK